MPAVKVPYRALPPMSEATRAALSREALRINDRYLHEVIEGHAFCPFARGGREAGQTSRYVFFADTLELTPLFDLMAQVAADPQQVVAQVILPLIEVEPDAWIRFCDELTAAGHDRLGGPPVLAFAALHPELRYRADTHFSLIPLFRRAPDPTIQWVRLDALAEIYAGRSTERVFVDPRDVLTFVRDAPPPPTPLYDRVARTNAETAHRLGLAEVEAMLGDQAREARESYRRILSEASGG